MLIPSFLSSKPHNNRSKAGNVIPGFGLAMGITMIYLTVMVIIPLSALIFKSANISMIEFVNQITSQRMLTAFRVSISASFYAAVFDAVFGSLIAWTLVRYSFIGKKFIDSLIDLPFALPTSVAGIALTMIYSGNGWIGKILQPFGIEVAYTTLGISLAISFIGLPFVVRTVQPVLEECSKDVEMAAASLGASPWKIFRRVILPEIYPSIITGASLAFARGLGEYGSIVFISGNMPMKTEVVPLLIMSRLEQFDYVSASAIALVFLIVSFSIVFLINMIQILRRKKYGEV